ncbi:hypothetical protein GCM10011581_47590 [Saccharopolyspora subtropica]|uniref:Uncharacterized protein n=1 Tax=Saccharopolyspora thermophila TaxID=89367 RepID=A0A917KA82_9PSEU|nr:hypothetical protein [Saccharopolyspora subtropica]GGJ05000.1 hypothetical protein GCM10011581_47590 [Saccharopolyspora subtropica]
MTIDNVRRMISTNNVVHYIQLGANAALCGVPRNSLIPPDPCQPSPDPCSRCPAEFAKLRRKAVPPE